MNLSGMSTEQRRENQKEAGLEFLPALELVVNEQRADEKLGQGSAEHTQARRVLRNLSQQETLWGIAKQELKKAAVTVPIFFAAALGVLWVNKRWIAK